MSRRFAIYMGLLGVAALATVAWPGVILIGLFLGIMPGLALWIAPSLFVYSLLWWGTRAILLNVPKLERMAGHRFVIPVVSAAIVATPAVLVPFLNNMRAEDAARSLQADDRETDKSIALPNVVALVIDGNYNRSKRKPSCESLCLRLLFNSAVVRVIAVDPAHGSATNAFWVERRETCPDHPNFDFHIRWTTDFPLVRGDNLEDRVRGRIAAGECLIEGDGRPEEAATTISYRNVQKGMSVFDLPWALPPGQPSINRLEISDTSGATIYRRTEVTMVYLTAPLQIAAAAGFLTTVTYVGWARYSKILGEIGPRGRDVLPNLLGAAVRKPEFSSPRL
jgi:hypothetical protein